MSIRILLGSSSDMEHARIIEDFAEEYGVKTRITVASAHKVPEMVVKLVEDINALTEPTVVITIVGMSNGLGGVVAGGCVHPVISCPAFKDHADYLVNIHSSVQMPSDVPAMTVIHPKNAALAALRILAESDDKLRAKLLKRIKDLKATYKL